MATQLSRSDYQRLTDEVTAQLENHWTNDEEENHRLFRTEMLIRLTAHVDDPQVGQLLVMLSAADMPNRLSGIGHFTWAMSEGISYRASLNGACEAAGLLPPAADNGPFDRLMDYLPKNRFVARGMRFVRDHAQPRRPERHQPEHR
jgi:hypothetical protein